MTFADRRRFQRIDTNLMVRLRESAPAAQEDPCAPEARDLSQGGAFIETAGAFDVGAWVRVALYLPTERPKVDGPKADGDFDVKTPALPECIDLVGIVRWRRSAAEDGAGVGVEFLHLEPAERELIDRYMNSRKKKRTSVFLRTMESHGMLHYRLRRPMGNA
jgi:c-di-GMP-binding flagellar brake protein YcgR